MDLIYENMALLIQRCTISVFVLLLVNILIGIWMVGGAIPSLIYYGLAFLSPSFIVPFTFLLCVIMSLFTGTSFGSIATMGVALYGVGISIGVPAPLIVGAIVSGAFLVTRCPLCQIQQIWQPPPPALPFTPMYIPCFTPPFRQPF